MYLPLCWIYRLVSLQLLILCGAGIPIGLLLGILSAKGVLIAATGLLNPDLFMANSTSELNSAINTASTVKLPMLFASIAVILLFALLAAFPAARYASHVSPTVAMSGQTVKIKRRIKRNRNIRNFEAYYARLNLKRGRGRTAVTILSLVMSITVFVALQSFTGLLDASSSVQDMYFSDYTRVGEIGMQRAIGMSAASLYKTFLWEGAYYGIIASVIGAVFGYVCCIFVGAAQTDALQLVAVPVMAIVEAAIISIVACLLATAIPLRSIARMSIVDSIETVE